MAGTAIAITDTAPAPLMTAEDLAMSYAGKLGRAQAQLDYVAAVAGAAAQVYDDPRDIETVRARLREIAEYAREAARAK